MKSSNFVTSAKYADKSHFKETFNFTANNK
jgi:hypothetical protein